MCCYCMVGDSIYKWNPPLWPHPGGTGPNPLHPNLPPNVPNPAPGVTPQVWPIEKAKEYLELLKQIKALEDSIGCPCPEEREKPNYIQMIQEGIDALEKNPVLTINSTSIVATGNVGCKCTECKCGK